VLKAVVIITHTILVVDPDGTKRSVQDVQTLHPPDEFAVPTTCLAYAQAYAAQSGMIFEGDTVRYRCVRK